MRKVFLFIIIGFLLSSCDSYNYGETRKKVPYKIRVNYFWGSQNTTAYFLSLLHNDNIGDVMLVNRRIHGTYITTLNPADVGYCADFYDYLDTTTIFKCKFIFKNHESPFDRSKFALTDFHFMDTDGIDVSVNKTKEQYVEMIEIISMKAFNELSYKSIKE